MASPTLVPIRIDSRRVDTVRCGRGASVWTVDDFLDDPEGVRREGLSLEYTPTPPYPGVTAPAPWYGSELAETVARVTGHAVDVETLRVRFSRVTTPEAELEPRQCVPHVDDADLAGIVYLTLPDECRGGTAFYRHRATGLEALPTPTDLDLAILCLRTGTADLDSLKRHVLRPPAESTGYMKGSNESWELTHVVEMRFNRLVVLESRLFHSGHFPEAHLDSCVSGRRLTLNFFASVN